VKFAGHNVLLRQVRKLKRLSNWQHSVGAEIVPV